MRPLFVLVLAVAASPLAGQGAVVDPPPFRWLTTTAETGFPVGYAARRVLRYQEVHDGLQGQARAIGGIAFRRSPDGTATSAAFTADVSMRLSTARTTAGGIAARFEDNAGLDVVEVLPRRAVAFPSSAGGVPAPAPFEFVLPADVPFAFAGAGPLCIDLTVHDHTNRTELRFALHADGRSHTTLLGRGCHGLALGAMVTGTTVAHDISGAPAGAPVAVLFGGNFDSAAGLPLPIDLAPLGAPGCSLQLDPLLALVGIADSGGAARLEVPVATAPGGAFYGAQAVALQPGVNPLGAVTSNAAVVLPRTGRQVGRVWAEDLSATSGLRQPVFGLVIEVR